ncbi:diacylglycerol kinase family lipid kinase [Sinorhizobium medicae]|uniref:Diacylglycerol kinase family lipid kinase n=1 Tax=Sinorhizobium medicae TaxID=110321 RepID=A0A6G1WWR7_9HYPH|nr:diacylglycerol kinase family protein [Sinorhizobium medicae]MQW01436.1 diacylglycerol kinase family lipid kinase [Sinorhizobium medicae]MQW74189.1 diacylglycerol kinase family lipid kinase [Sinorhizobium medicae]MQX87049.1 diacylglycerol kinase family lipid kinase [Sinorhizobium medicae]RVJ73277.1 diacylglycerol kinase family lipid kinase [Sinorhizobium medicae]WQO86843.1 diacylglycerol kinase family protein [Sinorhizobium medicae]
MKVKAIFNRDGGTFRTTDMDAFSRKVEEDFQAAGHRIEIAVVGSDEMRDALETACRRDDLDAIVAGGGDGTISAAAGVAWKTGMPLGIVPAGTMNLVARSLKLPLDIWKAPEVLAAGRVIDADIGSAEGRAFVHQFSMGLHARMVRYRESYQFASRLGKISASTRAAIGVIFNPPDFEIEFDADGHRERRHVSAISVSNNHFGHDTLMYADDLTSGHLGFYTAPPLSPAGVTKLSFDILRGKFRSSTLISEMSALTVDLHFPKMDRKINCVIDGELVPIKSGKVALRVHPGELKLLVGRQDGDAGNTV